MHKLKQLKQAMIAALRTLLRTMLHIIILYFI